MNAPGPGLATRYAPPFGLVAAHFAVGLAGMVAFAVALVLRAPGLGGHFFQPELLGLAHLAVFGWFLPVAFGALLQMVPVLFQVPLARPRLAWVALGLQLLGGLGLAGHMWGYATGLGLPMTAATAAAGVVLQAGNLLAATRRAATVDLTGVHVQAALLWLLVAVALGLGLAWNLHRPFLLTDHLEPLRAHVLAAVGGFFGLLIAGVAYRLAEMFLLAYGVPRRFGRLSLAAANLGLALLVVDRIFGRTPPLEVAGTALLVVAVAAYLLQMRAILARRMRRHLDVPWLHSLTSAAWLAVAAACAVALLVVEERGLQERLGLVLGLALLPGFVGSIIAGQLAKILPFLIWLQRFSPLLGLRKVPGAHEFLPAEALAWQWAAAHAGLVLLGGGLLVGDPGLQLAGSLLYAAGALAHAVLLGGLFRKRPGPESA